MPTYLTTLTRRIPAPVQYYWRTYGPLTVLLCSILGLWLGHGERYIQDYLRMQNQLSPDVKQRIFNSDGYSFGYTIAYLAVRAWRFPEQAIPWIGLVWSLAALTYWLAFRLPKQLQQQEWGLTSPWLTLAVAAFFFGYDLPLLLNHWVGPVWLNTVIGLGIASFSVVYCFWMYFGETRQVRRHLTETATQAELTALKAQVNPHFLFNSLNNIFGTALTEGGQRTPMGVQQLSGLLRYQLEKTRVNRVDVLTELRFLDDYVQFHRQMLPGIALDHHYEWDERPTRIAPLLLTPLVDYALQQQASGSDLSMQSRLTVRDRFLHYQLIYPTPQPTSTPTDALDNLQQRLHTLYPKVHLLECTTKGTTGKLNLTILLNDF